MHKFEFRVLVVVELFSISSIFTICARCLGAFCACMFGIVLRSVLRYLTTVKPHPEAHMDMILFEVFLKNIHLIPQDQIVQ